MASDSSFSGLESLKIRAKLLQKAKVKAGLPFALKDALDIVAKGAGFANWRELKQSFDATELFCPVGTSAHWKTWYTSYDDARKHLSERGGFLIPYRKHFFVCETHYLEMLGLTKDDVDLKLVGENWVEPRDSKAWDRLIGKIKQHQAKP